MKDALLAVLIAALCVVVLLMASGTSDGIIPALLLLALGVTIFVEADNTF